MNTKKNYWENSHFIVNPPSINLILKISKYLSIGIPNVNMVTLITNSIIFCLMLGGASSCLYVRGYRPNIHKTSPCDTHTQIHRTLQCLLTHKLKQKQNL